VDPHIVQLRPLVSLMLCALVKRKHAQVRSLQCTNCWSHAPVNLTSYLQPAVRT